MSGFKENKRANIEKGKAKGLEGIQRGEQRVQELQAVKGLIDSISRLEGDEDAEMAES